MPELKLLFCHSCAEEKRPRVLMCSQGATYLKVETERHLVSIRGNERSLNTVGSAVKGLNLSSGGGLVVLCIIKRCFSFDCGASVS